MRFLTLLPKALLLLLVIIGVIYCAPSAYAQSETKGGCEKFCASCDQGVEDTLEVANLMTECNCCVEAVTIATEEAQVVIASEPKVGKTRDDYED